MISEIDALTCLKTRRSIRQFIDEPISEEYIDEILECGRWAPSGINYQPWIVYNIKDPHIRQSLSSCTECSDIVLSAPALFVIFLDTSSGYNYVKSVQSIGAFFENLLLAIHALGLGGVWLGQIYNQKEKVNEILNITDENLEFMGAIAFGKPAEEGSSERKSLDSFVRVI